MTIRVTGLLHTGYRIGPDAERVVEAVAFYREVLGLEIDRLRPHIPTIPGAWMELPARPGGSQIHLFVADGTSPAARDARRDPTRPHVALGVADLEAAMRHLGDKGVDFWVYEGLVGESSNQVFFEDPLGNLIELQQEPGGGRETGSR